MSGISPQAAGSPSDPGKARRGDKKRAQKLIDAAYATGTLTAADRALRTDRVRSAHTKGDLAILVRDLGRAAGSGPAAGLGATAAQHVASTPVDPTAGQGARSLGSAIPPDQLKAMMSGASARTLQVSQTMRSALAGDNVSRVRRIVLIALVGFLLLCGLGIAGIVAAVFTGINQAGGPDGTPVPSVNLQTAEGWTELVTAVEEETGTSQVYDAVVYPQYASLNAIVDEGAMRYVYRDGAFQLFNSPVTPATGDPVDLADIDPDLVEGLPDRTAELNEMPEYESAYFIVRAEDGEPTIAVYVQETGRLSRWTIYDVDGKVIGGTPS